MAPTLVLEKTFEAPVAGVDEAGCGPWAGPVVAGAVILFPDLLPEGFLNALNDSKKLSQKKRENLFETLEELNGTGCHLGVGLSSVAEIDTINIRQSAMRAMERAVQNLTLSPKAALVDGTVTPKLSCVSRSIVKGDSLSCSIAAASVLAKVTRDRIMKELSEKHPEYGWEKNAGYGTKAHQQALAQWGITDHHRKSFAPIARLVAA